MSKRIKLDINEVHCLWEVLPYEGSELLAVRATQDIAKEVADEILKERRQPKAVKVWYEFRDGHNGALTAIGSVPQGTAHNQQMPWLSITSEPIRTK